MSDWSLRECRVRAEGDSPPPLVGRKAAYEQADRDRTQLIAEVDRLRFGLARIVLGCGHFGERCPCAQEHAAELLLELVTE